MVCESQGESLRLLCYVLTPDDFGIFINGPQTNEVMKPVFITTEQEDHYQLLNGLERWTENPNQASEIRDSSQVPLPEDSLSIYPKN